MKMMSGMDSSNSWFVSTLGESYETHLGQLLRMFLVVLVPLIVIACSGGGGDGGGGDGGGGGLPESAKDFTGNPTITAASCSSSDVQAAINSAKDGDTVLIPAGTCTWLSPVTVSTAITLQGAGIDRTIIVDGMPKGTSKDPIPLTVNTVDGKFYRLTALTFRGNNGGIIGTDGIISLKGTSKTWRIDHIKFDLVESHGINISGFTYGVIDNNTFFQVREKIKIFHENWNGVRFGDGSFADPVFLGTEKAVYIENNVFETPAGGSVIAAVDSWKGSRIVFRYNTVINDGYGNHGTESSGRDHGARMFEVYNNNFTFPTTLFTGLFLRSGTGVIFNNTFSGYSHSVLLDNYRSYDVYSPWGQCDGTSPYDLNDGVTYDTGTHTGGTSSSTMTTTGKTWTTDQWKGYNLHNTTTGEAAFIIANTANTITYSGAAKPANSEVWNTGDTFTILRASVCLDQVGRGQSDLFSGDVTPLPVAWPHQALEGIYSWNNTLNGNANALIKASRLPGLMQANRDFYDNTPKPGYTPYTYPHPLTLPHR